MHRTKPFPVAAPAMANSDYGVYNMYYWIKCPDCTMTKGRKRSFANFNDAWEALLNHMKGERDHHPSLQNKAFLGKLAYGQTECIRLCPDYVPPPKRSRNAEERPERPLVYIGNISYSTSVQQMKDLAEQYGEIFRLRIYHEVSDGKCYAFVHYTRMTDAERAVNGMSGMWLDGRQLNVSIAVWQHHDD